MIEHEKTGVTSKDMPSTEEEMPKICHGLWKLKPDVVIRVEEDGAILFDPDTDALSVINVTGSALLRCRRDRICYDEWCEVLYGHYNKEIDLTQIQADVKEFLGKISHFAESHDDESN